MNVARLSTKGQLVLPKQIRDALGLTTGSEVAIEVRDGQVVLTPIRRTQVDDLLGLLPWSGPPRSLDEMDAAIARGARERR